MTNNFLWGPKGELYKCSKVIGECEQQCGSIYSIDESHPNFKKWESSCNLDQEKCMLCSMVPICQGIGCSFNHLMQKVDIFNCDNKETKASYIEHLKSIYKQPYQNKIINNKPI